MTGWITRLLLAGLAFAAQAQPIVVGAVVSQSGVQADLAAGYAKGIQLWEAQMNAAGGLLGRPVELKMLDDGSDAVPAGRAKREPAPARAPRRAGERGRIFETTVLARSAPASCTAS